MKAAMTNGGPWNTSDSASLVCMFARLALGTFPFAPASGSTP